jgi:uncharacterized protein (DUF1015 family)
VLARFRAVDPSERVVLPHEHTRTAAKEDRWKVLLATRANFSAIFMMIPDPERRLTEEMSLAMSAPAALHYTDGETVHRLWRVANPERVASVARLLDASRAYIADGHHRYATALRYRDAHGPEGAWTLGYFTPLEAPGLLIEPYHRILSAGPTREEAEAALSLRFDLRGADSMGEAATRVARSKRPYAFALAWPDAPALVAEAKDEGPDLLPADTPRSLRVLDTYFVHRVVFPLLGVPEEAVSFIHSLAEAEQAVAKKACRLAVLLRGTPAQQIVEVAEAGESMPAKSTFFHPKLPSGLVIHPLAV